VAQSLIGRARGEWKIMRKVSIMLAVFAATLCHPLSAGEKGKR
jgi:hypothetical protein